MNVKPWLFVLRRMCAVFGGVYCLKRSALGLVTGATEDQQCRVKAIIDTEGQRLSTKWLIMHASYRPPTQQNYSSWLALIPHGLLRLWRIKGRLKVTQADWGDCWILHSGYTIKLDAITYWSNGLWNFQWNLNVILMLFCLEKTLVHSWVNWHLNRLKIIIYTRAKVKE